MKIRRCCVAVAVAVALIGCATNRAYYNPKRTQAEAQADANECRYDAKKFGYVQMWGTGVGPGVEQALREKEIYGTCMENKGYYIINTDTERR